MLDHKLQRCMGGQCAFVPQSLSVSALALTLYTTVKVWTI